MSFTLPEVLYLTRGQASAWLRGEIVWTEVNGSVRGEVAVAAEGFGDDDVKIVYNLGRRNFPSLVLTIRRRHCWRLDVNQEHLNLPGTHLQRSDATGRELEAIDARDMFPPIPEDGTVSGEQYHALLGAFARYFEIARGTLVWIDPPSVGRL